MRFDVMCRSCGHDFFVLAFRDTGQNRWMPDWCSQCQSDDLVALRDLTPAELEEVQRVIAERADASSTVAEEELALLTAQQGQVLADLAAVQGEFDRVVSERERLVREARRLATPWAQVAEALGREPGSTFREWKAVAP